MKRHSLDDRATRSRVALRRAFATLIQSERYENLKIARITTLAGTSRSTFYAHYSCKDALLAGSIAGPFAVLADTMSLKLIRLIEDRLKSAGLGCRGALILPLRLAAIQLAEMLITPITAWLLGESRCTAPVLAIALRKVSIAALDGMTA